MNIIELNTTIWEEKNSIEPKKNCGLPEELDSLSSTKNIEQDLIKNDLKDITKICTKCNTKKEIIDFPVQSSLKSGRHPHCKLCRKEYAKHHNTLTKEKRSKSFKSWRLKNKEKRNAYHRALRKTSVNYRIAGCLRRRVNKIINKGVKKVSARKNLGCSLDELKKYLESKFTTGMTWENHGQYGWHIDHINPLSSFDLENHNELLKAVHYTNLQPLWWDDNLKKSNR